MSLLIAPSILTALDAVGKAVVPGAGDGAETADFSALLASQVATTPPAALETTPEFTPTELAIPEAMALPTGKILPLALPEPANPQPEVEKPEVSPASVANITARSQPTRPDSPRVRIQGRPPQLTDAVEAEEIPSKSSAILINDTPAAPVVVVALAVAPLPVPASPDQPVAPAPSASVPLAQAIPAQGQPARPNPVQPNAGTPEVTPDTPPLLPVFAAIADQPNPPVVAKLRIDTATPPQQAVPVAIVSQVVTASDPWRLRDRDKALLPEPIAIAGPLPASSSAGSTAGIQAEIAPRPLDFAGLIDRLTAARDAAQPQAVTVSVTHGEFGPVRLHFRHEDSGLGVAVANADPDFARAVAAAPPVQAPQPGSDAGQARSDHSRQNAGGDQPSGQPRNRPQPERNTRHAPQSDRAVTHFDQGGIFA